MEYGALRALRVYILAGSTQRSEILWVPADPPGDNIWLFDQLDLTTFLLVKFSKNRIYRQILKILKPSDPWGHYKQLLFLGISSPTNFI